MSQDYSPSLVTKNLVFCGDAAMKSAAGPATLLYDKVNDNNGTMYNGTYIDCDGTDDRIVAANTGLPTGATVRTLSAWVKFDSLTNGVVVAYGANVNGQQCGIREVGGDWQMSFWSATYDFNTGVAVSTGTWYHAVCTYNGTTIEAFIDGASIGTKTVTVNTALSSAGEVAIGRLPDPQGGNYYYLNGQVADVRIYDVALSAANVKELYDDSKVIIPSGVSQASLIGWWPLTEGAGTLCYDGSGNGRTGTITGGEGDEWTTGQTGAPQLVEGYNRPIVFDADGYVNMWDTDRTLTLDALTDYTFSWWARSSDTGDNHQLFTSGGTSVGGFHFNFSGTGNPLLYLNGTNYSYWHVGALTVAQDDGQWHHWLLTYTGTAAGNNQAVNSSLYVDGVIQAHGSTNTSTAPSTWGAFRLGRATSSGVFSGELNEFAIYNGLLGSSERAALYKRGPIGVTSLNSAALLNNASYPMTSVSGASSTGIAATSDGSALDACNTTDSLNFVAGRTYRLSLNAALVSGTAPTFSIVDQIAWTVTKTGFGTLVMANGANTKDWTCTQTGTFVGVWYLISQAGSFVISDFSIVDLGDPLPPDAANIANNASGGTITTSDGWTTHKFTSSGTFTPAFNTEVEVLVVAGGGGGGTHSGGGGGAGGLLYYGLESPKTPNGASVSVVSGTDYTITVGGGGAGGVADYPSPAGRVGVNGSNSAMIGGAVSLTAIGGGGGGSGGASLVGLAGGCGGGGGRLMAGGAGTAGQGNAGSNGVGSVSPYYSGAGGGGAGATGTPGDNTDGGDGGVGLQYVISGTSVYYAGGGGGNIQGGGGVGGTGGNGGGGSGDQTNLYGWNATTNTGGGGGGSAYVATPSGGKFGNGGSGIVIIRYRTKSFLETKNIKAYWRNDGDATWADLSGNGYTGTVGGSPDSLLFTQGYNGQKNVNTGRDNQGFPLRFKNVGAVGFNGSDNYIAIPQFDWTSTHTLSWWFNPANLTEKYSGGYAGHMLCWGFAPTVRIYLKTDGTINIYASAASAANFTPTNFLANVGEWNHITYTADYGVGTAKVYQNGYLTDTVDISSLGAWSYTGASNAYDYIDFGRNVSNNNIFYAGSLGNVQIYNRVLGESEIKQNFAAQASRFQVPRGIVGSGLRMWLDAAQPGSYPGSGTTWYDLSGNDNNVTLDNGTTFSTTKGGVIVFNGAKDGTLDVSSWIKDVSYVTMSGWWYHNANSSGAPFSILTDTSPISSSDGFWWHDSYSGGATLYLRTEDSSAGEKGTSVPAGVYVSAGNWYHVAVVVGKSTFDLYYNGVLYYSWATGGFDWANLNSDAAILHLVLQHGGYGNGYMGNVQLYDRALSASQVAQNFRAGSERFGVTMGT